MTAWDISSACFGREGLKASDVWPGVCLGLSDCGQYHTWGRAGISHWLSLLVLCKGMAGAWVLCWLLVAKLWGWAGGITLEPPLNSGGEVQLELASMAAGHGRDQEYQAEAIDLSCPVGHTGMSSYGWETQDTSGSSGIFLRGRCHYSPLGSCQIEG